MKDLVGGESAPVNKSVAGQGGGSAGRAAAPGRVARIYRRWDKHRHALLWLFRLVWATRARRLLLTLGFSKFGVLVAGGGLLLLFNYAKSLENAANFVWGPFDVPARDSGTLLAVGGAVTSLLVVGFVSIYIARVLTAELCKRLFLDLIGKIERHFGGRPVLPVPSGREKPVIMAIARLQVGHAQACARSTRRLPELVIGVMIAIGGLGVLLYLHWQATLIVMLSLIPALRFYYAAGTEASQSTRAMRRLRPHVAAASKRALYEESPIPHPLPESRPLGVAAEPVAAELGDSIKGRLRSLARSELTSHVVLAVVAGALLVFLAREAMASRMSWVEVGAFVVVLKLAFDGIKKATMSATMLARQYPSLERIVAYFSNERLGDGSGKELPKSGLRLVCSKDGVWEGRRLVSLKQGHRIAFVGRFEPSRYTAYFAAYVLANRRWGRSADLLRQTFIIASTCPGGRSGSLRGNLGLPAEWTWTDVQQRLPEQGLAEDLGARFGLDMDAICGSEVWNALAPGERANLQLLAAEASERPIVVVPASVLAGLPEDAQAYWLDRLASRLVLIVYRRLRSDAIGSRGESRVIAVSESGVLIAVGSPAWYQERWRQVRACGARADERARQSAAKKNGAVVDEDEDAYE